MSRAVSAADFTPTPWLANRHAQTLWAALAPAPRLALSTELVELPDGDAVSILSTGPVAGRPAVPLLHGLEGSITSRYARSLLAAWAARGWCGVLLHARGAAQQPNRLVRGYHSGDWADAAFVTARLRAAGATAVAGVGVSLGGNALLKWLGETGADCPLTAAVAISVPFSLAASADALTRGFARVYHRHLLRDMHASVWAKRHLNGLTRAELRRLTSFRLFDDFLTAPQNGFAGVDDYYQRASCRQYLGGITVPTTILQATDDPFVPLTCVPTQAELPPAVRLQLTAHGGHVGFLTGAWPRPWLPTAVSAALMPYFP
jgi:hypothetical protein